MDNASTPEEALIWITKLKGYLELCYDHGKADAKELEEFICANFPPGARSALELLPYRNLSVDPLYALLEGFKTDLTFQTEKTSPIQNEADLELYASRVASTVAELCLDLVFHHTSHTANKADLYFAAREMGVALQYINIARDIAVDAEMGRVYLPLAWLEEEDVTEEMIISKPSGAAVERMRKRLLGKAFEKYRSSRGAMDLLPRDAKGPMIVAVESYMEIGRVLSEGRFRSEGRATVPAWRRAKVVWKTLRG